RQEVPPLRLGAVLEHDQRGHRVAVDHAGQRHPAAADLLEHPGVGRDVEAEAAVLARHEGAEEAQRAHAGHERVRVGVGVVEGRRGRAHVLLDEAPHGGDDARLRVHREWDSTMTRCPSTTWCSASSVSSTASSGALVVDARPRPGGGVCSSCRSTGSRAGCSSYGCVFTGGADDNLFTFANMKRPSGTGLVAALTALIVLAWVALKSSVITILELARAVLRLLADPVGEWRRGFKWLAIKVG